MPDNQQKQVRRIFMALGDLPEAKRSAALAKVCGDDDGLRAKVEALFHSARSAGDFLASPTSNAAPPMPAESDAPPAEGAGTQIDRFKLLEQIGEGGMGTIWLAEQREPVRRRVALKIIKLGMDTKQVIARFEAERQALAMMDHAHIAKVFDAGTTATGRPYFVMEYIKGVPIVEYCDTHRLGTQERLDLFIAVCQAIQHAHQKGIIHRDIKPNNVLVTLHDGVPVPKVIDFGIAKAIDTNLTNKTLFTEHHQLIGTPEYMSPEQAEMSGLDIDTRSDVYSLGVLLYELLTGTTPFDVRSLLQRGLDEMLRTIREDEPDKPSTRISTLGEMGSRAAQQRRVEVKRLGSILRGDLDWIVMKCLEKDRTRRYETANGLAADIMRHLRDEPISAGAPSVAYRLQKFARRNRVQVITGGIVATALLLGLIGTGLGLNWALDERDKADLAAKAEGRAKVDAQQQAKRAEEQTFIAEAASEEEAVARKRSDLVAEFMGDMLKGASPGVALGRDITLLKEMLDASAARIEGGDLDNAPEAELQLRSTIGMTYCELALYEEAQLMFGPALTLARQVNLGDDLATAEACLNLGYLFLRTGEVEGAEPLLREAREMFQRLAPGNNKESALAMEALALSLEALGDPAAAEPLANEALAMRKSLFEGDHESIASSISLIAGIHFALGEFQEAEDLQRDALAMFRRLHSGDHPSVALALNELGVFAGRRGGSTNGEQQLTQALEMLRRIHQDDHPDIATTLNNLASAAKARGDQAAAEAYLREAIEAWRSVLPGDHQNLVKGLTSLGMLLTERGDYMGAQQHLREAADMSKRLYLDGHLDTATALCSLGVALKATGDSQGAIPVFMEAKELQDRFYTGDHRDKATVLHNLAAATRDAGDPAGAELLMGESIEMTKRLWPDGHADTAGALHELAQIHEARGDLEGAEELLLEAIDQGRSVSPGWDAGTAVVLSRLGVLRKNRGDLEGAEAYHREAVELARGALPAEPRILAGSLVNHGQALRLLNQLPDAEALITEAIGLYESFGQPGDMGSLNAKNELSDIYWVRGEFDAALRLMEEIAETYERHQGKQHIGTVNARGRIGLLHRSAGRLDEAIPLLEEAYEHAKPYPQLAWVGLRLLEVYAEASREGDAEKAVALAVEWLAKRRLELPKYSPRLTMDLEASGVALRKLDAHVEAEPYFREGLAMRRQTQPEEWQTYFAVLHYGELLMRLERTDEAEPLLLEAYRELTAREADIPAQERSVIQRAVGGLVHLYEATENETEAAAWRSKL